MAEAKTRPTTISVADHLAAIADPARRADCQALAELMSRVTGHAPVMWGPAIVGFDRYRYRYASGHEGESCLLGFSSRKTDISIYVNTGFDGTRDLLASLGRHKTAKACLYLKSLKDIDLDVLEALLRHAATEMRRRHPTQPDPESTRHD